MKPGKNKYTVKFAPEVTESIKALNPAARARIKEIIDIIAHDPEGGVVLQGKLAGSYLAEKASYKVIYSLK